PLNLDKSTGEVIVSSNPSRMNVFALVPGRKVHSVSHPERPGSRPAVSESSTEDELFRVGTAVHQGDGSYLIRLMAFPIDGTLLMRPAPSDEASEAGQREGR